MERVAIIGLGLIGGSLGLALRRALPDIEVLGLARRAATADAAVTMGAATSAGTDPDIVSTADLVVVACSLSETAAVLDQLAGRIGPGARVTDVGSIKVPVMAHAAAVLDPAVNPFVGGHPMAGKEVSGLENADADLFQGRPWVLTPQPGTDMEAFSDLVEALEAIGARTVLLEPEVHDRYVALVSHLPFLLSAAYLLAVEAQPHWKEAAGLASSGFRDISRLGGGDPAMYAAITAGNREEVLGTWAALHAALDQLEAAIARDDTGTLLGLLEEARQTRADWLAAHPEAADG